MLNHVATEGIKWMYTTALAPWQEGFYERLVSTTKRCLRTAVGRELFSFITRVLTEMLPKMGDVVLVKDDNLPRAALKLGKTLDLFQGRDEKVRSAEVLLPGHTRISRAINCLYPLEMPICEKETDEKSLESSSKQQS